MANKIEWSPLIYYACAPIPDTLLSVTSVLPPSYPPTLPHSLLFNELPMLYMINPLPIRFSSLKNVDKLYRYVILV